MVTFGLGLGVSLCPLGCLARQVTVLEALSPDKRWKVFSSDPNQMRTRRSKYKRCDPNAGSPQISDMIYPEVNGKVESPKSPLALLLGVVLSSPAAGSSSVGSGPRFGTF